MMTGLGRIIRAGGLALAALMLIAAPQANAQSSDVPARYKGNGGVIRVPTNPASTGSWIGAVIEKYQLDKKYNVKIDFQTSSITQLTAQAIQTGAADLATFQFVQIGLMRKAGTKIVSVAPFLAWGANQVIVPVDSKLKTVGDLKDKKLGIFNNVDIDWIVLQAIAKRDFKMDPAKDIKSHVAGIGLLQALIQQGELDATVVFNNLTPQLVSGGKVKVMLNIRDLIADLGLPEMPFLFQSVREEYAAQQPENVRAYLAAFRESIALLAKDDEIWKTHGAKLSLTPDTITRLRVVLLRDLMPQFKPSVEADVQKAFEFVKREAPAAVGGLTELQTGWITLDYQ